MTDLIWTILQVAGAGLALGAALFIPLVLIMRGVVGSTSADNHKTKKANEANKQ